MGGVSGDGSIQHLETETSKSYGTVLVAIELLDNFPLAIDIARSKSSPSSSFSGPLIEMSLKRIRTSFVMSFSIIITTSGKLPARVSSSPRTVQTHPTRANEAEDGFCSGLDIYSPSELPLFVSDNNMYCHVLVFSTALGHMNMVPVTSVKCLAPSAARYR